MYVEQVEELSGGGGYTIHLSYRVVVEEVIHPVEEVILLLRFYCHPQSQLGMGIRGLGLGLDNNNRLGQDTGGGAWCPRDPVGPDPDTHHQWLGVNLTQPHVITSVLTQGR